jgi:hypothetical protein
MTKEQAQTAVTLSAFVVAAVYIYRRLVETNKTSSSTAHFVIGFGFTYITLGVLAEIAPPLGGSMAYLIALGDFLANGSAVLGDLTGVLGTTRSTTAAGGKASSTTTTGAPEQAEQPETANQPLIG